MGTLLQCLQLLSQSKLSTYSFQLPLKGRIGATQVKLSSRRNVSGAGMC